MIRLTVSEELRHSLIAALTMLLVTGVLSQHSAPGQTVAGVSVIWSQPSISSDGVAVPLGDVNGDGLGDWVVGYASLSSVYVYSGLTQNIIVAIAGPNGSTTFGLSVAAGRDLNGDGVPDFLAGDGINTVAAYSGASGLLLWQSVVSGTSRRYGFSVAIIGDANNDGLSDVVIGDPGLDNSAATDYGLVEVRRGTDGLLLSSNSGGTPNNRFGRIVQDAGDINGDGDPDFVISRCGTVGGWQLRSVNRSTGVNSAFLGEIGPVAGPSTDNGFSVAGLGDINGDGYDDFAVGEPYYPSTGVYRGRVRVYGGGPGITSTTLPSHLLLQVFSGPSVGNYLGTQISSVGDVDGNGCADFVVWQGDYESPAYGLLSVPPSGELGKLYLGSPSSIFVSPSQPFYFDINGEYSFLQPSPQLRSAVGDDDLDGNGRSSVFFNGLQHNGNGNIVGSRQYAYIRISPHSVPIAPAMFTASANGCGAVTLRWKRLPNPSGYELFRNGQLIATLSASAASYLDGGVQFGQASYQIRGFTADGPGALSSPQIVLVAGGGGQSNSTIASLTINGTPCSSVGPFLISASSPGFLTLQWQGPPLSPFALAVGPMNIANTSIQGFGILDIGTPPFFSDILFLFDGSLVGSGLQFTTDLTGAATQILAIPSGVPTGPLAGLQGLVFQPPNSTALGVLPTAAYSLQIQ